jgi:hypothetical protein
MSSGPKIRVPPAPTTTVRVVPFVDQVHVSPETAKAGRTYKVSCSPAPAAG